MLGTILNVEKNILIQHIQFFQSDLKLEETDQKV